MMVEYIKIVCINNRGLEGYLVYTKEYYAELKEWERKYGKDNVISIYDENFDLLLTCRKDRFDELFGEDTVKRYETNVTYVDEYTTEENVETKEKCKIEELETVIADLEQQLMQTRDFLIDVLNEKHKLELKLLDLISKNGNDFKKEE